MLGTLRSHRLSRVVPTLALALPGLFLLASASPVQGNPHIVARPVKVLVITSSADEAQPFVDRYRLTEKVAIAGLPSSDPNVLCNADDVCALATGMGKANAAASVAEVVFGGQLDLTQAYFLLTGTASIDPLQGTLGSTAWASQVVDFAISWEIDARSLPAGWKTGYLGIGTTDPTQMPTTTFGTEVYPIAPALLQEALKLSKPTKLGDDATVKAERAHYTGMPAAQPPSVIGCDTMSSDTVWGGALLGARATAWTSLMSGGTYCTAQQEDNATLTALARGDASGLLDAQRALVLHAGSRFDRPYTGQTAFAALTAPQADATALARDNLALAGGAFIDDVVSRWSQWQKGVAP
jgi:purine nucleoside permease